jgi:2-amino-4-hydroxy-6-hydroxymethyldihydropteridine diphosphokinase
MDTEPKERREAPALEEHRVCLGLGSNVKPASNLRRAIRRLRRAVSVDAVSTAWQSPAVGVNGPDYFNAALLVRTPNSKEKLIVTLKQIENDLGRVRDHGTSPLVTIDIDLLVYDGEPINEDLWTQVYRAAPVSELLPDLASPSTPRPEVFNNVHRPGTLRINPFSHNRTRTP